MNPHVRCACVRDLDFRNSNKSAVKYQISLSIQSCAVVYGLIVDTSLVVSTQLVFVYD